VLKAIPRQKIRDVVVERLKSHITSEGLKPGDRLPNETALAEKFGVSRLTIREATKGLELFGILESKSGVGLTVGTVNLERITGHLGFHRHPHRHRNWSLAIRFSPHGPGPCRL
jgi:DNA-binding FadR family transcriptional regulator